MDPRAKSKWPHLMTGCQKHKPAILSIPLFSSLAAFYLMLTRCFS